MDILCSTTIDLHPPPFPKTPLEIIPISKNMAFQTPFGISGNIPCDGHGYFLDQQVLQLIYIAQVSFFQINVKPWSDINKEIIYVNHYNVQRKRKNAYSLTGSSSIGPSLSKYWLKAVYITVGLVQTAEKFSFSVMHAIPDGIPSQTLEFSRQQTLSRLVGIVTQFPQMHLNII